MAPKRRKKQGRGKKGEGSVYSYQRDGRTVWQAALEIDGRVVKRNAPDREAAEAKLAELKQLRDAQIDIGGSEQTVTLWMSAWLEVMRPGLRESTYLTYRHQIETYILPAIGDMRLCDLKANHIQSMLDGLIADIQTASKGRRKGTRTAQMVAQRLDAALDLAVERDLLQKSPMRGVVLREDKPAKVVPPTVEQVAALLRLVSEPLTVARPTDPVRAMLDLNDAVLFHAYALLGLRRGEGLGLRWADVDLSAGTLRVTQQIKYVPGAGRTVDDPKSDAGVRTLPVPRVLADLLRRLQAAQAVVRLRRGNTWFDQGLVVTNRDGGPLWPRNVSDRWYELRAQAGMPGAKLHHLRHSVATLLDEAGASEAIKRDVLGHESTNVTQRYTAARIDAMRAKLEQVAERVTRQQRTG